MRELKDTEKKCGICLNCSKGYCYIRNEDVDDDDSCSDFDIDTMLIRKSKSQLDYGNRREIAAKINYGIEKNGTFVISAKSKNGIGIVFFYKGNMITVKYTSSKTFSVIEKDKNLLDNLPGIFIYIYIDYKAKFNGIMLKIRGGKIYSLMSIEACIDLCIKLLNKEVR